MVSSKASAAVLLLVRVVLMASLAVVLCLMAHTLCEAFSLAYMTARQAIEIVEAWN